MLAFAQTIHMTASFLSPLVAFHILDEKEHMIESWRTVFYLTGFIAITTYVVYQIWGTADVQPWNDTSGPIATAEQEELMNEKRNGAKTNETVA